MESDELAELIRTLDHARDGVGNKLLALARAGEDLEEQKRDMAKIEDFARLDRDAGKYRRLHLLGGRRDASGDRRALLIELVLPQQAGQDRPAQHLLIRERRNRRRALMRASGVSGSNIQTHESLLTLSSWQDLIVMAGLGKFRERQRSALPLSYGEFPRRLDSNQRPLA